MLQRAVRWVAVATLASKRDPELAAGAFVGSGLRE